MEQEQKQTGGTTEASPLSAKQRAAQVSAQARRQQGHDRRAAAGIPCRRCWICFPETGKRTTRPPTRPAAKLEQPSPYSEPPKKEPTFAERALLLAEAGTTLETAALIEGMETVVFQKKVEETYGVPWETVLERAKAKVKSDLIASAIRAARLGDWKAYLSLEKQGIKLSLVEREEEETAAKKEPTTLAEIEQRIAELRKENAEKAGSNAPPSPDGFEGVTLLE